MSIVGSILPLNASFLSSLLYEGYIRYLRKESVEHAFEEVSGRVPEDYRFPITKNDRSAIRNLLNINVNINNLFDSQFRDKFLLLCKSVDKIDASSLSIILKSKLLIGGPNAKYAAPQILKVDRYTGFSSTDEKFTSKQVTIYLTKEAYILGVLGIYSAFVTSEKGTNNYYFLTFSPDESQKLLISKVTTIDSYLIIKDSAIDELRKMLAFTSYHEAWILELYLAIEVCQKLHEHNLNKISLLLFKVAFEGGQTYKVYETTPITIYKDLPFIVILKEYVKDMESFMSTLRDALDPSKPIIRNISNLNSNEYSNLINALRGIYKFIVLGDPTGLNVFSRELMNAYEKVKDRKKSTANFYLKVLKSLSYTFY